MNANAAKNKATELIDFGILNGFKCEFFREKDLELEVKKHVEKDTVKSVTQEIIKIAESRGLIKDAPWHVYHAGFIKLTAILGLILAVVIIYRTW